VDHEIEERKIAMRSLSLIVGALLLCGSTASAANKRLLLVTHSGGFIHSSVADAEMILKKIGPDNGFDVTCFRFTEDPDKLVKVKKKVDGKDVEVMTTALEAYSERFRGSTKLTVAKENCGRINKETLKNFDIVLFYTTGNPVNKEEMADLLEWVKEGGAFSGTHCASDTLYGTPVYGELVGAYFDGHPWHQKIKLNVEDSKHPGTKGFTSGDEITDEIYQFRPSPYSRERLHILLSVDNSSIDVSKGKREDKDYAVSWCQQVGKGRSFYTSLGHRKEVWEDKRFQTHLFNGMKWATGELPGDATPTGKTK